MFDCTVLSSLVLNCSVTTLSINCLPGSCQSSALISLRVRDPFRALRTLSIHARQLYSLDLSELELDKLTLYSTYLNPLPTRSAWSGFPRKLSQLVLAFPRARMGSLLQLPASITHCTVIATHLPITLFPPGITHLVLDCAYGNVLDDTARFHFYPNLTHLLIDRLDASLVHLPASLRTLHIRNARRPLPFWGKPDASGGCFFQHVQIVNEAALDLVVFDPSAYCEFCGLHELAFVGDAPLRREPAKANDPRPHPVLRLAPLSCAP